MFTLNKKQDGLTLVEVIASLAVLSIVITGIITMFVQATNVSQRIDFKYTALNIAKNRIERARSIVETDGLDSLPDLSETETTVDSSGAPSDTGKYRRTTTVTEDYGGEERLTRVDAEVEYKIKDVWQADAGTTLSTLFVDME